MKISGCATAGRRPRPGSRAGLDHPHRRQAGRHDLRLHGEPEGLQARRQGRGRGQARRQGGQAPGRPRGPDRPAAELSEQTSTAELISWPTAIFILAPALLRWTRSAWRGSLAGVCGVRRRGTLDSPHGVSSSRLRAAWTRDRPADRDDAGRGRARGTGTGVSRSGPLGRACQADLDRARSGNAAWTISGHSPPVDVLLGGPLTEYVRLARAGKLEPLEAEGETVLVRRAAVGDRLSDGLSPGHGPSDRASTIPASVPSTLTWAAGQLRQGSWQDGYASLVQLFSAMSFIDPAGGRIGPGGREPWRGRAGRSGLPRLPRSPKDRPSIPADRPLEEGAAILRGTRHAGSARGVSSGSWPIDRGASRAGKVPTRPRRERPAGRPAGCHAGRCPGGALCAWDVLDREAPPASAQAPAWLTEPPPWPPASVAKLQTAGGDRRWRWSRTLPARSRPIPSRGSGWCRAGCGPRRLIDESLLTELAQAAGGRLVREPRFRAWLRGEWTAWARQRYRRVARLVARRGVLPPGRRRHVRPRASRPILNPAAGRSLHDSRHHRRAGQAVRPGRRRRRRLARDRAWRADLPARPPGRGQDHAGPAGRRARAADDGEIYFDDRIVHALPPHERRVGMVFPDFALWPGMTVAENVAYPLKIQGLKGPERRRRVGEILSTLRIDSLAGKRPEQLSRPRPCGLPWRGRSSPSPSC